MIYALERVELWDIIKRGGLEAEMSTLGLSQGRKQLLCLARAMLRDGKVIALDEATSSVDVDTDAKMRKVIKEEFKGRTVITVAHRLESIVECDIVAVLDGKRLVRLGVPMALGARDESVFRGMTDVAWGVRPWLGMSSSLSSEPAPS
jgi:ABC-type multidrug transport system fused ATPase/permease subunit